MKYGVILDEKPGIIENHLRLGGRNSVEEIQVNSRYFIRNGRPWIPVVGEFHYLRSDEGNWEKELLKMKAGGITVVSCYVIWICHEETEGVFDFHGRRDLRRFLKLADKTGLKVILRIGPWVHGEVRNGGFPDWLLKKGCPLRQDDREYLKYVKRFFEKIFEQSQEFLFYNNGPVWAIQIENELTDQPGHLLTLRHMAEDAGLKVPIYTVTGWNSRYGAQIPEYDVVPVFGGYPEAPWEAHKEKLEPNSNYFFLSARNDSSIGKDLLVDDKDNPDVFHMKYELYPFATCELGGGMQVTHHRRPVMGHDDVAALALVKLGCGNNMPGYYMYHGGVNEISETTLQESKATGYPNDYTIRSYDFQAPVGEYGQIRASYSQLRQQHLFIQTFMDKLAAMDAYFQDQPITDRNDKNSLRYSVRTDMNSGFVFINNFQRLDVLASHEKVQFEVPAGDGMLVFPQDGMSVPNGAYLIIPYYLDLGNILLIYATAQPLYRKEDTWFFFAPFGITCEYCFETADEGQKRVAAKVGSEYVMEIAGRDGGMARIVTLTQEEAESFFVLDDEVYLTEGSQLYIDGGKIHTYRMEDTNLSFSRWNGRTFEKHAALAKEKVRRIEYRKFVPDITEFQYSEELFLDGNKKICGYELSISQELTEGTEDAFLEISYTGDVLQIYVDGILAADDFCKGTPCEVSISYLLKYGNNVKILISELKENSCYMEAGEGRGLVLRDIRWIPVYGM